MAFNVLDIFLGNFSRQFSDYHEGVACQAFAVGAAIGMILILKRESAIALNAIRKVRVAASHQDEIAIQGAVSFDRASAVNSRVEAVVCAQKLQRGAFCEQFGRGTRNEELLRGQFINDFSGVQRIELNAKTGMSKFRPLHDFLNALAQDRISLRKPCRRKESQESNRE